MESDKTEQLELTGTIIRGVGTGGQYVALQGFSRQFEKLLGGIPFPGTLNIRICEEDRHILDRLSELKASTGITIEGFSEEGKDYFPAITLRCSVVIGSTFLPSPHRMLSFSSLVVFPETSVHPPEILEIVSTDRILDHSEVGEKVTVRF